MRNKIRQIYLISIADLPNGAENVLLKLAIYLKGQLIFTKKTKGARLDIPHNVARKYLANGNSILGMLKLAFFVRNVKENELLISTHPYLNAYLGFLKRIGLLKSRLVVRECTSVFSRFSGIKKCIYKLLYRIGYPGTNLVICQTDQMRQEFIYYNAFIPKKRVIVQPNPIDFKRLEILAQQTISLEEQQTDYICAAGRFIPEKGFDILIQAFQILRKLNPELKLFLLGEGEQRKLICDIIERNNLQDAVILKGHVANPAPYFRNAKLCVVSSLKEGFPNVLLEMMAVNQAIVSTLCAGGISEIPNLLTSEVNNVEALAKVMQNGLQIAKQQTNNPHISYLKRRSSKRFASAILSALRQQS